MFKWFRDKAEKEIYKNINPIFGKWLEDYSVVYKNYTHHIIKLYTDNGSFGTNELDGHFSQRFEDIKKEIAIIVTDPNPIFGLRYSAHEVFYNVTFHKIIEMPEYQNRIHDIIENHEEFSDFIQQVEYEASNVDNVNIRFTDMDAEEIFTNLAIRHIDLQLMLFALLELKEGLSEFPTTNYLHYLHAANHFEAEWDVRETLKLEQKITDKEKTLISSFCLKFLSNEVDKNPHYEWQKELVKNNNQAVVDLIEEKKLSLYPI